MMFNSESHHRRSIRLRDYDYSSSGAYFVTICAWQRECLFGEVVNGEIRLNAFGEIVQDEWRRTPMMRPNVELDAYIIMPNHFHVVFCIHDVGAHCMRPVSDEPNWSNGPHNRAHGGAVVNRAHVGAVVNRAHVGAVVNRAHVGAVVNRAHVGAPLRRKPVSIGSIMAGFKSAATKRINQSSDNPGAPVWQRNYYERVIRDERELDAIRQ